MLKLPGVTLVLRDVLCPELARLAVMDTLRLIEPERTIIFSNTDLNVNNTKWVRVRKWPSLLDHCNFFWYEQHKYIKTPWFISIEWDGWVLDPEQWTDNFLDYDYVGAPWWHNDKFNVGNGLGLRSNKLMKFLSDNRETYPVAAKEDEVLCRDYRSRLECYGFRWAPEQLAAQFSFECTRPSVGSSHFMFHDSFNFPVVLSGERLDERVRLMRANPYITRNQKLRELEAGRAASILDRLAS